jgi:hypothetical protein
MQPWVRATDAHLGALDQATSDMANQISSLYVPDKTAYVPGPAASYAAGVINQFIPASSTVQFVNNTGLIQVTISASLSAALNGSIGAGFYLDGTPLSVVNSVPSYGVQFRDTTNTAGGSGTGMSYTVAIPVRKGLHVAGIFYNVNNVGSGTSQILSSTLIVQGV